MGECKFCGQGVVWKKFKLGWKPLELDEESFHNCIQNLADAKVDMSRKPNTTKWKFKRAAKN